MYATKVPAIPRRLWIGLFVSVFPALVSASPLASAWGFQIDLPEEYRYVGGDGRDRFSFQSSAGTVFDLRIYPGSAYPSVHALIEDIQRRLKNQGTSEGFEYRKKQAEILQLRFSAGTGISEGWGLCVEMDRPASSGDRGKPLLLALAYGPSGREDLQMLHFSALDSIAPTQADRHTPGPITEYLYPRNKQKYAPLAGLNAEALIDEDDAEAAQYLVDREFQILRRYANSSAWKEAWSRFYRAIYRDSFDRLAHIAFVLEREWNIPSLENRDLAGKALEWVQSFQYERNLIGSDFVNLVTAATEGRGDCDSRAMLWAIILEQANIPSAIMVSVQYKHAMGLAELPGVGAHFPFAGKSWLVAETTADVPVGLISANTSDSAYWMGIAFE
ncbi:MAG: hypothetical protein LBG73_02545 [Spirochaetaceae bacterium]|jgi:hypothetical protein|nr:hypothetical protein [Spirochaetaceae bacterium]